MKRIILALAITLPVMAQAKKAEAPKPPAKTEAAQTKQADLLDPVELYALQRASEDAQAAAHVAQQKEQVVSQIASSIQQKKGCHIQQRDGKLGCWADAAPAKK